MKIYTSDMAFRAEKSYHAPTLEVVDASCEDILTSSLPFARGNELPYRTFGSYGSDLLDDDSGFLQ